MAPEFQQYRDALRRNIKADITRAQEELLTAQEQLKVIDGLPTINASVPGPENGTYSFSTFAHKAMDDVLYSTPDKKIDSQQSLHSILDISKSLESVGIPLDQKISLRQESPTVNKGDSPKRHAGIITFNGKEFVLSIRLLQIFRCFENEEGTTITSERLAHRIDASEHSIAGLIHRLRAKLEDSPRNPVFFVTTLSRDSNARGFVYRSPERVAREQAKSFKT